MTPMMLDKRLSALEVRLAEAPINYTPEERAVLVQEYAESLANPLPPDPRAVAYWANASLRQLMDDYAVMLNGGPAPWQ